MTRSTKAQMATFAKALIDIVEADSDQGVNPVTVRQAYYRAVAFEIVDKTQLGYRRVVRQLGILREDGRLPWEWIADNARVRRQIGGYDSLEDAVAQWQASYRRDYWAAQPFRVELWTESDAISTALSAVVMPTGVPIYTARGQSSKTFVREAAQESAEIGKPIKVIYVGDFDPTGLAIDRSIAERYDRYGDVTITLDRVAVTPDQVRDLGLASTTAKQSDPNFARFADQCDQAGVPVAAVETEAIPPADLRALVVAAIDALIDPVQWGAVAAYEAQERDQLAAFFEGFR